ncbi:MAG: family 16 glycosylhydrolase [Rikenellaceae bacterium]
MKRTILALFVALLSTTASAQQAATNNSENLTIPNKSYEAAVDFSEAPQRKNNKFPLSDQDNTQGWKMDKKHSDEFRGKSLNEKLWMPSAKSWKGRQPTFFHSSNIELHDGYLVMKVNKHGDEQLPEGYTHTSAFISSHEAHLYGYYEARLKPNDSPWVTGFWMSQGTPEWWTEIDICENCPFTSGNERDLNSNVHVFRAPPEHGNVKEHFAIGKKYYLPFRLQDDFHTWGMDWTEEYIRLYIDGVLYREIENTHWHQPLHVNINNESNKWFGALPDDNYLDSEYYIDYFRVWHREE